MLIGILQCGHFPSADGFPEHTYGDLYQRLLKGQGFDFRVFSVVDMEFPEDINAADGWLISGSKYGAYEDIPFIPRLEDFIRDCYAAHVTIVGVCFGHQIIAQALGGTVEKFSGGWSLGRQTYDFEGAAVALNAWHQDQVTTPPDDAQTVATSELCQHAALAYRGKAFSVQAHPEFDRDEVALLMQVRRAAVPPEMVEDIRAGLDQPVANTQMADRIARFFKESLNG